MRVRGKSRKTLSIHFVRKPHCALTPRRPAMSSLSRLPRGRFSETLCLETAVLILRPSSPQIEIPMLWQSACCSPVRTLYFLGLRMSPSLGYGVAVSTGNYINLLSLNVKRCLGRP
ncbi:hypothetical protein VTO42DRAFT_6123 [Malbranchea cinnamomea]